VYKYTLVFKTIYYMQYLLFCFKINLCAINAAAVTGCLQLLEILRISWNFVDAPEKVITSSVIFVLRHLVITYLLT